MTTKAVISGLVLLLSLTAFVPTAHAELRWSYRDDEVVARSELIIVGHLKPDTIRYIPHPKRQGEGRSWEHHAILAVAQVLKGQSDQKELPIVIHYGLDPLVGGQQKIDGTVRLNLRFLGTEFPAEGIQILDTGNSGLSFTPLVPDAREDHLWFLRKRGPSPTGIPVLAPDKLGIIDPEDLQPIWLKDYFLAHLSSDPEKAVREQFVRNTAIGARALRYLHRLEIRRISEELDPARRAERLMPYYLSQVGAPGDARKALVACGPAAGPYLLAVFDDPHCRFIRWDILLVWRDTKYVGCVDRLIELLKMANRHYARVTTRPDWEASKASAGDNTPYHTETYYSVCALGAIGDPRAREVIEQTLAIWKDISFANGQIAVACEFALKQQLRQNTTAPGP